MDRHSAGGQHEAPNENAQRLKDFRDRHKGSGFFYRMLDVPYGIEMAADEVARFSRAQAVWWALGFDACLTLFFGLFWVRYDLWSTWDAMDPLATSLGEAAKPLVTMIGLPEGIAAFVGSAVSVLIRTIAALLPSLVQFRMPYDASRHDAMWMALWISIVFDLGTDSVDIRALVTSAFQWLIDAAQNADTAVWLSLIALGVLLLIVRNRQWPLWVGLIVVSVACIGWDQGGNVVYWANVAFWTVFASFAAQSIFFIYAAKVFMLFGKARALTAVGAA
jgi:hypothetical protein